MIRAIALLLLLSPTCVFAACNGTDLRATLNTTQRAELEQRLANRPFSVGNHWRAEKGTKTLTLIGTLHVGDPRFEPIVSRLTETVQTADLLMLEADAEEQAKLQNAVASQPDLLFLSDNRTLIDLLSPMDWERLKTAAKARGVPGVMAARFQPWYLSVLLQIPPCITQSIRDGAGGLDKQLMDAATKAGVAQQALEPFDTFFRLFSDAPLEKQLDYLRLSAIDDGLAENVFATLAAQYFDEEPQSAIEVSRLISRNTVDMPDQEFDRLFDELMDQLLRVRNQSWMVPIEESQAQNIVIAVGAAHLGGEFGLLNLLQQAGYTLNRLPF